MWCLRDGFNEKQLDGIALYHLVPFFSLLLEQKEVNMTRLTTICTFCLCTALFCSAALFAQSVGRPKITSISGGFFAEWDTPVELAAVQLDKKLGGIFEVMFDVPSVAFISEVIDRKTPSVPDAEVVTALAGYWITRGKPERAIPLYEASLKQGELDEPRTLLFQNNLAMLYSRAQQHDKALEVVNNALEAKKDHVPLLNTKGLILLNSGNPEEAVKPLSDAVELSCQVPIYCMHLAVALKQLNRDTQARRWLDPVRDQLIASVPKMTKENKAMFDELQTRLPPIAQ